MEKKEKKDQKKKKVQSDKPVTVHITNHNKFEKGVGAFITNLNHLTIVMDSEGNMKLDANQVPIMPHTDVDVEERLPEEDEGDDDVLAVVKKCFKSTSEFTKEKVKKIIEDYYNDSNPNLALIEITLYDHDQLWHRNDHKPFVEALVAWGLLNIANDEVMDSVLSSIRHKHSNLPKEGGYENWGLKFKNEKNTCTNIGKELGETMPYRYKKKE